MLGIGGDAGSGPPFTAFEAAHESFAIRGEDEEEGAVAAAGFGPMADEVTVADFGFDGAFVEGVGAGDGGVGLGEVEEGGAAAPVGLPGAGPGGVFGLGVGGEEGEEEE